MFCSCKTDLGIGLYCISWFPWEPLGNVFYHLLALIGTVQACTFENLYHVFASKDLTFTVCAVRT